MRRPNGAGVSKWTAATSTFDLEKVACMRGIVQCVAKFTSRLGVNVQKRLAAGDLVAEADGHLDACRLRLRRSGELGELGDFAIVDMDDAAGARRDQRMNLCGLRWLTKSALRLADRHELRPGTTVDQGRQRKRFTFPLCGLSTDLKRGARQQDRAASQIVRRIRRVLKNRQDVEGWRRLNRLF